MARAKELKCKICRRFGEKLFLKGEKCYSDKCILQKRGEKPQSQQARMSVYAIQLKEKQKAKFMYGLLEKNFERYYEEAQKKANPGDALLTFLEMRLDNVVYRLGFASSRAQARQLVSHGHIRVNNKKVNIPSYQVKVGDEITIGTERLIPQIKERILEKEGTGTSWLILDKENLKGKVISMPNEEDLRAIPVSVKDIIEFYSR
ncbi:MAG: 30S ribosomal protein S4 [candidate division WOR-3 bacterium]|nr:30S ribosomal protein S4 [candidate division WOR-3 bacterium]MCX7837292.1 30S ribosomal protein S4 [candidate division WOR-3 bacterium]MDW8113945.1 30S ribosomal protein S4 [candidate division WOR-3 bacterium]